MTEERGLVPTDLEGGEVAITDESPETQVSGSYAIDPEDVELPTIKWVGAQACMFDKGGETVANFEAVIVGDLKNRAWYEKSFEEEGGGQFPDCYSTDMLVPHHSIPEENKQHDNCRDCPMSKFGSAPKGDGKWCSEKLRVIVLIRGERIPSILHVPVTSHKAFARYLLNCENKKRPVRGMFSKFYMTKELTRNKKREIATLALEPVSFLGKGEDLLEKIKRIEEINNNLIPVLRDVDFTAMTEEAPSTEEPADDEPIPF